MCHEIIQPAIQNPNTKLSPKPLENECLQFFVIHKIPYFGRYFSV